MPNYHFIFVWSLQEEFHRTPVECKLINIILCNNCLNICKVNCFKVVTWVFILLLRKLCKTGMAHHQKMNRLQPYLPFPSIFEMEKRQNCFSPGSYYAQFFKISLIPKVYLFNGFSVIAFIFIFFMQNKVVNVYLILAASGKQSAKQFH